MTLFPTSLNLCYACFATDGGIDTGCVVCILCHPLLEQSLVCHAGADHPIARWIAYRCLHGKAPHYHTTIIVSRTFLLVSAYVQLPPKLYVSARHDSPLSAAIME